jgi:hypothetical protein
VRSGAADPNEPERNGFCHRNCGISVHEDF